MLNFNLGMSKIFIGLNILFYMIVLSYPVLKPHFILGIQSINYPLSFLLNNFQHANLIHLGFNMLVIYQFGDLFDNVYKDKKKLLFGYLFSGLFIGLIMYAYILLINPMMQVVGYSGVVFFIIAAVFKYLSQSAQKSILIQLVLFHVIFIIAGMPISWQSHLTGAILGYLFYVYNNRPKFPKIKKSNLSRVK